jgi:hypothetical protein
MKLKVNMVLSLSMLHVLAEEFCSLIGGYHSLISYCSHAEGLL